MRGASEGRVRVWTEGKPSRKTHACNCNKSEMATSAAQAAATMATPVAAVAAPATATPSLVERHTQKAYSLARRMGVPLCVTLYVTAVLIIILTSTYIHAYNKYFTDEERLENKSAHTLHVLSLIFAILVIILLSVAIFYYARYKKEEKA